MKKIAGIISTLVLSVVFSATCAAMQFHQPIFIGSIAGVFAGGPHPARLWKISKEVTVKKDVMIMGSGKTALKFKYKDISYSNDNYKSREITDIASGNGNLFPHDFTNPRYIQHFNSNHSVYQLNGENGIVAYVDIDSAGGADDADSLTIRGLWKDGKAVTFVNSKSLDQYRNRGEGFFFVGEKIRVQYDTICVPYVMKKGEFNSQFVRSGELRFKWDDKAYWFGIEDVVY